MMEWDEVRDLALSLEDVAESTSYGAPCVKVRGKWFAGLSPHKQAAGALVIRCDPDERPLMLAGESELFYVTPHYEPAGGYVLIRLEAATEHTVRDRLEDAWHLAREKRR